MNRREAFYLLSLMRIESATIYISNHRTDILIIFYWLLALVISHSTDSYIRFISLA